MTTKVARKRSKGYVLITFAAIALTVIPMVGMAIDCAVLYVVKARLSAACDAAALAAARNLNLGQTMTAQEDAARARALSFYNGNFKQDYLGATRNAPVITIPTNAGGSVLTVTVTGSARAKTYFLGMLPHFTMDTVNVVATGTASRRDVKMMIVLDRSDSLNDSNSCTAMKTSAIAFVNKFVDGRDTVGLLTFGTNTVLAFSPARNFKSAGTNIVSRINQITCNDATSLPQAYWQGYQTLVASPLPNALNTIVLFTDGIPNGIHAEFPVKRQADTRFGYDGASCGYTAQCSIPASTCDAGINYITGVLWRFHDNDLVGYSSGLYNPTGSSVSSHGMALQTSGTSNCAFRGNSSGDRVRRDIAYIRDEDVYANKIRNYSNQYKQFVASGANADLFTTGPYTGTVRPDRPITIGKASSNLLDHAAQRVRGRVLNNNVGVVTFVVGLGSYTLEVDKQPDDVLMRRVANDPASPIYARDAYVPDGMYIRAENATQMAEAFQRIASEVLRLSR